jgi:hypothetical protein
MGLPAIESSSMGSVSLLIQLFKHSAFAIDGLFSRALWDVICPRVPENTLSDSADMEGIDSISRAICWILG